MQIKEIDNKIKICNHLNKLRNKIFIHYKDSDKKILSELYLDLVLAKLYYDRNKKSISISNFPHLNSFTEIFTLINSKYPFITFNNNQLFENILTEFKNEISQIDFNYYEFKNVSKVTLKNACDFNIELAIFDNFYEYNSFYDIILDSLSINNKDYIYLDSLHLPFLRYITLNGIDPIKIFLDKENSIIELKYFLIYCLLYNISISRYLKEILSFENTKEIELSSMILLLKDESKLNDFKNVELLKGFISDIKNPFNYDLFDPIIQNNKIISNYAYDSIENGKFLIKNALLFSKSSLKKGRLSSIIQKLPIFGKNESENDISTSSITINFNRNNFNFSKNISFYPNKENIGINEYTEIATLFLFNQDSINLLLESFDEKYLENIENQLISEKIFNTKIPTKIEKNIFFNNPSTIEINLISKQQLKANKIIHPFFYRKDFVTGSNLYDENLNQKAKLFFGTDIADVLDFGDKIYLSRKEYTPIIQKKCISTNFFNITFLKFKTITNEYDNFKAEINDILLAFDYSFSELNISYTLLPDSLEGAIIGNDIICIRPNSSNYNSFQIINLLGYLFKSDFLNRIKGSLNNDPDFLNPYLNSFILEYFKNIQITKNISSANFIFSFSKDLVDLHYYVLINNNIKILKFIWKYLDPENSNYEKEPIISIISLIKNNLFSYVYKTLSKPENLYLISNNKEYTNNLIEIIHKNEFTISLDGVEKQIISSEFIRNNFQVFKNISTFQYERSLKDINDFNLRNNSLVILLCNEDLLNDTDGLSDFYEIKKSSFYYILFLGNENLIEKAKKESERNNFKTSNWYLWDGYSEERTSFKNFSSSQKDFLEKLNKLNLNDIKEFKIVDFLSMFSKALMKCSEILNKYTNKSGLNTFFLTQSFYFQQKAINIENEYVQSLLKKAEWEQVIDELAHSINTNIGAARNSLYYIYNKQENEKILESAKTSDSFLQETAELVTLTLDHLKVDISTKHNKFYLSEVILEQIKIIIAGIETLKFSLKEQKENILKMEITTDLDSSIIIDTYEIAAKLIIKDLLKNALLNADIYNPEVSVRTKRSDDENNYFLIIENNTLISEEWAEWINHDIVSYGIIMSKSRKVGLRVVKKWINKLNWKISVRTEKERNKTITTITIPILWK